MITFLTSSPFVNDADRPLLSNANGFVDQIREALPPFPRCLFVASDPEGHEMTCRFGADVVTAFAQKGIFFESYQILDGYSAEDAEELVYSSDFIVLAGGHVPTQNAFFQDIRLRELLENWDGVVMGISAGTMNAADTVYVQPEEEGESDPEFPRFLPGLGLTDLQVCPHYQKVKDDILDGLRLFEDITYADSMGQVFYALRDGSYILCADGEQLLFGEAYAIRDGQRELICVEDACVKL